MNAVNHTATALAINRLWPGVPIVPVLVSVQFIEILWVLFNLLGVEQVELADPVRSISDVHLVHIPFSHSVAATLVFAALVWLITSQVLKRPRWGVALAAGVCAHLLLDISVHVRDIPLAPGIASPKLGTGLWTIPVIAFFVEFAWGLACWYWFKGSKALLAVIVGLNLAAITFYFPAIAGLEQFMTGRPEFFVGFMIFHISLCLLVIGWFARADWRQDAVTSR